MPKMKSHKGAAKRFSTTGTGKIRRRKANLGHLMETKSQRRVRRLENPTEVSKGDLRGIKRLLGKA